MLEAWLSLHKSQTCTTLRWIFDALTYDDYAEKVEKGISILKKKKMLKPYVECFEEIYSRKDEWGQVRYDLLEVLCKKVPPHGIMKILHSLWYISPELSFLKEITLSEVSDLAIEIIRDDLSEKVWNQVASDWIGDQESNEPWAFHEEWSKVRSNEWAYIFFKKFFCGWEIKKNWEMFPEMMDDIITTYPIIFALMISSESLNAEFLLEKLEQLSTKSCGFSFRGLCRSVEQSNSMNIDEKRNFYYFIFMNYEDPIIKSIIRKDTDLMWGILYNYFQDPHSSDHMKKLPLKVAVDEGRLHLVFGESFWDRAQNMNYGIIKVLLDLPDLNLTNLMWAILSIKKHGIRIIDIIGMDNAIKFQDLTRSSDSNHEMMQILGSELDELSWKQRVTS